jgi:hypothetical protein
MNEEVDNLAIETFSRINTFQVPENLFQDKNFIYVTYTIQYYL